MAPTVPQYFASKSVFITGATGFMGKILVEKLLRCCPDVEKIYLLVRSKKGQSSKERLDVFVNSKVFHHLHAETKSLSKLMLIPGDILSEDMGISNDDREELQREVQILFHCAACVRFDMDIKGAVNLNVVGTSRTLKLAEGMKKLEVFLHVSTAYSRCELPILEEKLYPSKHEPQDIMDCVKWMEDDLLAYMQPKLIDPQPNTYAYTKSLTEDLVSQYAGKFPIAIARPSIVTAALKEPFPGWVDNLNGPTGLLVGAGKGVIRSMHCNKNYRADAVPVDMVVNGCILLAYSTGVERPKEIQVVNLTESGINPMTWGTAIELGREHVREFPFSICLWYPGGTLKSNWLHHQISVLFTHLLPAYFIDLLLFLMGQKTFMVKIQKRISYGLSVLQYYTTKEWYFANDNYLALREKLTKEDNHVFYTDMKMVNWSNYIKDYIKGAREFCLKEDPSTLSQARKLNKQLYYLDAFVQFVLMSLGLYFVYYYIFLSVFK